MPVTPYLFFDGCCEEALEFYKKTLGAEVGMLMRVKESPQPPPDGAYPPGSENKIMHSSFRIGGTTVMASDGCAQGKPKSRASPSPSTQRTRQRPIACSPRSRTADKCECRSARRSLPGASAWSPTVSASAG